jgi:hypothetical protein
MNSQWLLKYWWPSTTPVVPVPTSTPYTVAPSAAFITTGVSPAWMHGSVVWEPTAVVSQSDSTSAIANAGIVFTATS